MTVLVGVNGFDRIGRNFFRFFRSLDAQTVLGQNTDLELELNTAEVVCRPSNHRSESLDVSRKVLTVGRFHRHDETGAHRHEDGHRHEHGDHSGCGTGSRRVNMLESIFAENDVRAAFSRRELDLNGIHTLNLMSSPESGTTTVLQATRDEVARDIAVGVIAR